MESRFVETVLYSGAHLVTDPGADESANEPADHEFVPRRWKLLSRWNIFHTSSVSRNIPRPETF